MSTIVDQQSETIPINGDMAEVVNLPVDHVKYIEVEIKSPGYSLFKGTAAIRGDLSVRSLIDRFHNLHPDVENTVKRVGYLYPPIDWKYLNPNMDMVIEYSRSEWVRIRVIDRPNDD